MENINNALNELFIFVDSNTIKSFTHQIMRDNNLNAEFKFTRRGFEFYAGYNSNVIQCQFDESKIWTYNIIDSSSIIEAVSFLKGKIQEYMISKSIWNWESR